MTPYQRPQMPPRMEAALAEMRERITSRYSEARFAIEEGEDPPGTYLIATVDIQDMGEVVDLFIDRLVDLQVDEGLPIYVIPVHPPERNLAILAQSIGRRPHSPFSKRCQRAPRDAPGRRPPIHPGAHAVLRPAWHASGAGRAMNHQRAIAAHVVRGNLDRRSVLRRVLSLGMILPALTAPRRSPSGVTGAQTRLAPPDAPARPEIFALPGGIGVDLYAWLENPDDPDVMAYLKAENAYTEAVMAPTRALQATLYREMTGRFKRADDNVPTPWHGFLYYQRTEEGKDYAIICRRQGSMDAPEQILLDLNAIGGRLPGHLPCRRPSPDNRYLAFNLDQTGAELYTLFVLDMASGQVVAAASAELRRRVGAG